MYLNGNHFPTSCRSKNPKMKSYVFNNIFLWVYVKDIGGLLCSTPLPTLGKKEKSPGKSRGKNNHISSQTCTSYSDCK